MRTLLARITTLLMLSPGFAALAQPSVLDEFIPIMGLRPVTTVGPGGIRLARQPNTGNLYILKMDGTIYRITPVSADTTLQAVHTAAEHGVPSPRGMAAGPDGALYLVGNRAEGDMNVAVIKRGVASATGGAWNWTVVAETEPYPLSNRNVDHLYNAVAVSPDGRYLYVNAGSRTDHGEVQSNDGKFPGVREVPLTSAILRIPADTHDLVLPNDETALRNGGYLHADGVRNTFDLAFNSDGDLFGTENSGDRDDNEELNWLRGGHHYGFPWRMGTSNTPQQYPGYDPLNDTMVNKSSYGFTSGFFHNDPAYPAPPSGVTFTDPIMNHGPDAVRYRDSATGMVRTGDQNNPVSTFTSHRSPLGLVFNTMHHFPGAFVLSWTEGTAAANDLLTPLGDPGGDMLYLGIQKHGAEYHIMTTQKVITGFAQPIDAEAIGDHIYILEMGGGQRLWEVRLLSLGVDDGGSGTQATLSKPYPNPASDETRFMLNVPRTGHVTVEARDILGNHVATLHDGPASPDTPIRLTFNTAPLPNGHYMIMARGSGFHASEGIMVVR